MNLDKKEYICIGEEIMGLIIKDTKGFKMP